MHRTFSTLALTCVLSFGQPAAAQMARQEVHPLQSMTLADADFLNGKKDGTPVTLSGILRLPKVGNEKLPAVVLLHGSGGLGGTGAQSMNGHES